ncbi:S-layer homology domain-containing protein [Cohnella endophytica]|uniref:S-layer homology domain-containing protein n=1 Tax=Cohnella endophytica TaxID=2419778 RepID=A0A494XIG8_9BACL|nr:S-layer homology domain-containing protein [Cohnella endophytica]RKP47874.1 S-layer homology domain-containing protein [Cohnella endophytica]
MASSRNPLKWLAGSLVLLLLLNVCSPVSTAAEAQQPKATNTDSASADKSATNNARGYSDVPETAWYAEAVNAWITLGILNPKPGEKFDPQHVTTRGDFAIMLAFSLGLSSSNESSSFKDVPVGALSGFVAALHDQGLAKGYPDGTFRPNLPITRAEMASWLAAAKKLKPDSQSGSRFRDVPLKSWYAGAVGALTKEGITSGKSKDRFDPDTNINMGEAVTLLYRSFYSPSVIQEIRDDGTITINGQSYRAGKSVQGIFQPANKAALRNAAIQFTHTGDTIESVEGLIIGYKGALSGQNSPLVFDGAGNAVDGNVNVSANQVALAHVEVKGDLFLTPALTSDFYAYDVLVHGKTIYLHDEGRSNSRIANIWLQHSDLGQLFLENSANVKKVDLIADKTSQTGVKSKNEVRVLAASAPGPVTPAIPTVIPTLSPGLYVQVLDGLINVTSGAPTNFAAGQFGFTPNFTTPPVILPSNPGIKFTPPPVFNQPISSSVPGNSTGTIAFQAGSALDASNSGTSTGQSNSSGSGGNSGSGGEPMHVTVENANFDFTATTNTDFNSTMSAEAAQVAAANAAAKAREAKITADSAAKPASEAVAKAAAEAAAKAAAETAAKAAAEAATKAAAEAAAKAAAEAAAKATADAATKAAADAATKAAAEAAAKATADAATKAAADAAAKAAAEAAAKAAAEAAAKAAAEAAAKAAAEAVAKAAVEAAAKAAAEAAAKTATINTVTVQAGTSLNYSGNAIIDNLIIGSAPNAGDTPTGGTSFSGSATIKQLTVNGDAKEVHLNVQGTIANLEVTGNSKLVLEGSVSISNLIVPPGVDPAKIFANAGDLSKIAAINGQSTTPVVTNVVVPADTTPPAINSVTGVGRGFGILYGDTITIVFTKNLDGTSQTAIKNQIETDDVWGYSAHRAIVTWTDSKTAVITVGAEPRLALDGTYDLAAANVYDANHNVPSANLTITLPSDITPPAVILLSTVNSVLLAGGSVRILFSENLSEDSQAAIGNQIAASDVWGASGTPAVVEWQDGKSAIITLGVGFTLTIGSTYEITAANVYDNSHNVPRANLTATLILVGLP